MFSRAGLRGSGGSAGGTWNGSAAPSGASVPGSLFATGSPERSLSGGFVRRSNSTSVIGGTLSSLSSSAAAASAGGEEGALGTCDHPEVTCIFADVVGWTSIAAAMAPAECMGLLGRLFGRFDALAIAHGVYKVETIGDSVRARALASRPFLSR